MPEYVFKPGLLEEIKPGKHYYGHKLDQLIGSFLIRKGLVKTEDCCIYSLNFDGGTTINIENILIEGDYTIGDTTYTDGSLSELIENLITYVNYIGENSLIVYSQYDNDEDAGTGGVPLNGIYECSSNNDYGMPEGMLRKRKPTPS